MTFTVSAVVRSTVVAETETQTNPELETSDFTSEIGGVVDPPIAPIEDIADSAGGTETTPSFDAHEATLQEPFTPPPTEAMRKAEELAAEELQVIGMLRLPIRVSLRHFISMRRFGYASCPFGTLSKTQQIARATSFEGGILCC